LRGEEMPPGLPSSKNGPKLLNLKRKRTVYPVFPLRGEGRRKKEQTLQRTGGKLTEPFDPLGENFAPWVKRIIPEAEEKTLSHENPRPAENLVNKKSD